jgi:hypothetical protein
VHGGLLRLDDESADIYDTRSAAGREGGCWKWTDLGIEDGVEALAAHVGALIREMTT